MSACFSPSATSIMARLAWITPSQSFAAGLQLDDRVERVEVVRIHLERLLEVVERLARLVLPLLDHAEAVVDEDRLLRALGVAVLDQDRLVQLERLLPVLLLEQQVGHARRARRGWSSRCRRPCL
jgi:hypothetical protein